MPNRSYNRTIATRLDGYSSHAGSDLANIFAHFFSSLSKPDDVSATEYCLFPFQDVISALYLEWKNGLKEIENLNIAKGSGSNTGAPFKSKIN